MIDEPIEHPSPRAKQRHDRLRDALRENLKRRKSQSRGRTNPDAIDKSSLLSTSNPAAKPDSKE